MKVYINSDYKGTARKLIEVKLVEDHGTLLTVELPDGRIIERKKNRDLPKEDPKGE